MSDPRTGTVETEPAHTAEALPVARPDEVVRCRACGHTLTQRTMAIEVQGGHEHTFRNPAGYSFHVVCFREAPGCLRAGTPTAQASWFAGYEWCFAMCGGCAAHVGWWYLGQAGSFAGLIATRLS